MAQALTDRPSRAARAETSAAREGASPLRTVADQSGSGGPAGVNPAAVHHRPRFVLRFDFPDDVGPRYACPHPEPPHDWALTGPGELSSATSFDDYDTARRVLDYDFGARTKDRNSQGHHGAVVVLESEVLGLERLAAQAMHALRTRKVDA